MNADGTGQKRLTNQPGDDSHPKFSPDGKKIIFNSARTTPDLSASWLSQHIEIFTMDTNGFPRRFKMNPPAAEKRTHQSFPVPRFPG